MNLRPLHDFELWYRFDVVTSGNRLSKIVWGLVIGESAPAIRRTLLLEARMLRDLL